MITGKDKGKTGKVARAFPRKDMILISGINVKKRHQKSKSANQKGQVIDVASPIHVSNVMITDDGSKRARVGKQGQGDKKVRINKKTGKTI